MSEQPTQDQGNEKAPEQLIQPTQPEQFLPHNPEKPTIRHSRLSFVSSIYLQLPNTQPSVIAIRFARNLNSQEQQFGPRTTTIGNEWQPLEKGWIENCSVVVIANMEGSHLEKIPTKEEQADLDSRIVQIAVVPPESQEIRTMHSRPKAQLAPIIIGEIRPLETFPFPLVNLPLIRIRCLNKTAKVSLTFYPD